MYHYLSVSFFLIVTFVTEPLGQFQHKIAKSILKKGELKSVKKKMVTLFFSREIILKLLETRRQIKMKNLNLNNNLARNT